MARAGLNRRRLIQGFGAVVASAALPARLHAAQTAAAIGPYSADVLPPGIRSRFVDNVNGIRCTCSRRASRPKDRPAVLLLHGFPELAYSWRKVMLPIAAAGYHVIAPDLRGYGRTSGTDVRYDDDLAPFRTLNEVRDMRRAGVRVRLPLGRRGDRTRLRLAARGVVRARAAGRLPFGGDDERAVRRSAGAAVQHR